MNTEFFSRCVSLIKSRLISSKFGLLAFCLLFLGAGCANGSDSPSELAVTIPTPLAGLASPTSDAVVIPQPVIEAEGESKNEVRPTWTPLPAGTVRAECEQPAGWTRYSVQSGNTLSEIAKWSGSTVDELAEINCIADVRRIEIGQTVFVPTEIRPTQTPTASPTPVPTETPTATATQAVQTEIDYFYIDGTDLAEISGNDEITLRWQIIGPGEFVLTWDYRSLLEPEILEEGEQGEYALKVQLPDISGTILFELSVSDESGKQTSQTIEIELP
ncbi:MAG: LysM peptidoglycan-binding domain-containing protein [Anaerolineae bacterium]